MNTIVSVACFVGILLSTVLTVFAIRFADKVDSFLKDLEANSYLSPDAVNAVAKDFIRCMLTFAFAIVAILITSVLIAFALGC